METIQEKTADFHHEPVMPEEILRYLAPAPGKIFADGTLGGGGHSALILRELHGRGHLYGIDRDQDAILAASQRLGGDPAFTALHGNFHDVLTLLPEGIALDGGLLDLGVSSWQLDCPERGFSYHENAYLDMRMDRSRGITAAEYLAQVSEKDFARALYDWADEKWAARIAKVLCEKAHRNHRGSGCRRRRGDTGRRAPERGRAQRPPDLPGRTHRGQRRNRSAGKGAARLGVPAQTRRQTVCAFVPFH